MASLDATCIRHFSGFCVKTPAKAASGRKGCFSTPQRVLSITTGKSYRQEPEADGYIAANLIRLFIDSRTPDQGMVPSTLRVGLLKLLNPIWKLSLTDMLRDLSPK